MIPIKKEPKSVTREFRGLRENCVFCGETTLFWNEKTNNPVCETCSENHEVSELVTHRLGKNARKDTTVAK